MTGLQGESEESSVKTIIIYFPGQVIFLLPRWRWPSSETLFSHFVCPILVNVSSQ